MEGAWPLSDLGQVLHYRLLERLGGGGMGVVYKALDTHLERTVALKFLPNLLLGDEAARNRLQTEAQAAARLDHPNIGTIYSYEHGEDGRPFITMAYYLGETLEQIVASGPLPLATALDFCRQVVAGLDHAHANGVIHHDIKPANLLLTPNGQVKILDFGVARLENAFEQAVAEAGGGTLEYMSPEQVRGQPTDRRTDLWSLGVVLYELLTGVSPFRVEGGMTAAIMAIISREPAPAISLRPELPPQLDELLFNALAKRADERYASAKEMLADLENFGRGAGRAGAAATLAPHHGVGLMDGGSGARAVTAITLPALRSTLVGRRDEAALVATYLGDPECRIVTLLGPGGTGKTRLSLEVAHTQLENFAGGVYFVPLDTVSAPEFIPSSIAESLKLQLQPAADTLQQVIDHLGDAPVLLLLDNYEHLIDGAAVASELLRSCRNLKLLVTSRVRLELYEEWILPLAGLAYPDERVDDPERALEFGAVELIHNRARRVLPGFELGPDNLCSVLAICRLVHGLPLGLELAAAWFRLLPPEEIAREIGASYDFLESSSPDVSPRHRSIRAVFEYSWALLAKAKREMLCKLAVFSGGFDREAAAGIVGADIQALAALVDRSLLELGSEGRYQHHPLLLQFLHEKLADDPDEYRETRRAHARYFFGRLEDVAGSLRGTEQKAAMSAVEQELENIRSAWQWAVAQREVEDLARAVEPLRVFYDQRGLIEEGLALFLEVIEALDEDQPEQLVALGRALVQRAWLLLLIGDYEEATRSAEHGLELLRKIEESLGVVLGLNVLGAVAERTGDYEEAKRYALESYDRAQARNDLRLVGIALDNLGSAELSLGEVEAAKRHYQQGLSLSREVGNHTQVVYSLNNLGNLALSEGRFQEALPLLEEGIDLARSSGLKRIVPFFLANLGITLFELADYGRAEALHHEALQLVRSSGERWFEAGILVELARVALARGDLAAAAAWLAQGLCEAWSLQDTPLVLHNLAHQGELLLRQGDPERAVRVLSSVVDHPATQPETRERATIMLTELTRGGTRPEPGDFEAIVVELLPAQPLPR